MMLDYLGDRESAEALKKAANAIEAAVIKITREKLKSLAAGKMGYGTKEVGDMVAAAVAPMTGFFQVAAYAMRGTDKANAQTTTSTSVRSESPAEPDKDKETKS